MQIMHYVPTGADHATVVAGADQKVLAGPDQ